MKFTQAADVIDVRVCANDGFDDEAMTSDEVENTRDLVTRVNDQSFTRGRVTDNRAVTLQHADRDGDVDQSVVRRVERTRAVKHSVDYSIGVQRVRVSAAQTLVAVC